MENKKEYCIFIRQGQGRPYILDTYENIEQAKFKLYQMISLEEERLRPYFVDNDFFNNKYNIQTQLKYFCIQERNISEWTKYSEMNETILRNNKIININSYKTRETRGNSTNEIRRNIFI